MAREKSAATEAVKPSPAESVYTAKELVENHRIFNTSREIVVVALRKAGKKEATLTDARKIIDNFKNREVK